MEREKILQYENQNVRISFKNKRGDNNDVAGKLIRVNGHNCYLQLFGTHYHWPILFENIHEIAPIEHDNNRGEQ
jgi:hypothetical protein